MDSIRVDFHCHSLHSDGTLSPRELAELLSDGGVVVAALTDHDSLDGLTEFRRALARREVGFIPAVEITTEFNDREAHLLAYGIDENNFELQAILASLRHSHAPINHSVADSLRTRGSATSDLAASTPNGKLSMSSAIALIHRAGGRAFLAHPIVYEPDIPRLETHLAELKAVGLDGIEAYYAPFTVQEREMLAALAKKMGLLVCAGTDTHDRKTENPSGIEMPIADWKAFRDAVGGWNSKNKEQEMVASSRGASRFKWRNFIFHFIFPTFLAIGLFITAIYALFIPKFEQSLIERKREMIQELTNSAWSILAGFEGDERAGRLTREAAQEAAAKHISQLRYGREGKDYFWLQDMTPRIIMHPYRTDLNGKDVSEFRDANNEQIFIKFADKVRREKEGYEDYVWQWKDDSSRFAPKESYVKGFAPWGWIIGTGMYTEDVKSEINNIERKLLQTFLIISVIVVLLLLYVIYESLRLERERAEAEKDLLLSTERYRSLVESTTEGTLLVMDNRCRYANHIFLEMLECSPNELELLVLTDMFPENEDNKVAWEKLKSLMGGNAVTGGFDAVLRTRSGKMIDCVLTLSRISIAGGEGFIVHSRSVAKLVDGNDSYQSSRRGQVLQVVIDKSPVGMFLARATARGTFLNYNQTAADLLAGKKFEEQQPLALADLFSDSAVYDDFLADLQSDEKVVHRLHQVGADLRHRTLSITAKLLRDEQGVPKTINGVIEDITDQQIREAELLAAIERLQTPLLFLHEPISRLIQRAVYCTLDMPVGAVAILMTEQHVSAALVQAESGNVVGILTDGDIRQRLLAKGLDKSTPVHKIMTAPIVTINEQAVIYEALLRMEQRHVNHLAVTDESGQVVGTIFHQVLLKFEQYGPIVLTREIEMAGSPEDVVHSCKSIPGLVKVLLDSGAHSHVINRLISSACDATTKKLCAFAIAELGASPVPFLFMSLGSQGRQEMNLYSDQDNAIIYEPPADPDQAKAVEQYLLAVGKYVCEWLDRAGYSYCRGDVMAQNPRWCQPLNVWKRYFTEWIESAEPEELLKFTIFFDFNPVYGTSSLAVELRQHLFEKLPERPAFYSYFAQNSIQFKPPMRLFGRILSGSAGKETGTLLDLKEAVIPLVSFARLYSLRQGIDATNTLERLQRLTEADILNEASCQAISEAYKFLTRLNLKQQAEAYATGQTVDNKLHARRLGPTEQTLLNQSFAQIEAIQKQISYDFLSGMA